MVWSGASQMMRWWQAHAHWMTSPSVLVAGQHVRRPAIGYVQVHTHHHACAGHRRVRRRRDGAECDHSSACFNTAQRLSPDSSRRPHPHMSHLHLHPTTPRRLGLNPQRPRGACWLRQSSHPPLEAAPLHWQRSGRSCTTACQSQPSAAPTGRPAGAVRRWRSECRLLHNTSPARTRLPPLQRPVSALCEYPMRVTRHSADVEHPAGSGVHAVQRRCQRE